MASVSGRWGSGRQGSGVGVQASGFRRLGLGVWAAIPGPAVSTVEIETLHPKIGQLVVEWDF